ncbi:MAG TPA: hypothetical protein VK761_03400 [Solirubrobacteraceae bacterium]|jgi:hypothetical protein|nr:hypothetical protein [Solirubrobacteraceae bacterium]
MRIVVNHVTRMTWPRICIAGIDPDTSEHVRPTTRKGDRITRELLREAGGPFGVGAVVDLGDVAAVPSPPETEDHRFSTRDARHVEDLDDDRFLELLARVSSRDLASAFGPALERLKWKYAVGVGQGEHSLAVIRAKRRPRLSIDSFDGKDKLQLRFDDVRPQAYVPVTDVRFYEEDQKTIRTDLVDDVERRLRRGVGAFLMFGLAHAYQASNDDRERHWLQLNGLCLVDRPTGRVP